MDAWLYGKDREVRTNKSRQHVESLFGHQWLIWLRVGLLVLLSIEVVCLIVREFYFKNFVRYFTQWGILATFLNFLLLVISQYKTPREKYDSPSLFQWWKLCSFLSQVATLWNLIIVIIYWGVLYDGDARTSKDVPHNVKEFAYAFKYIDHLFPFVCTSVDWWLNSMCIHN